MTAFLQACGGALVAVILILAQGSNKQWGAVLSLLVCCMVLGMAAGYLQPVVEFLGQLEALGNLDSAMMETVLKVAGIGLISEISALVCSDAGNGAMGKAVQMLGSAVMLWLSVPMFTALLELVQRIIGES